VAYRGDRDREGIPRRATGQGAGRGAPCTRRAAAAREREREREVVRDGVGSRSSNAVLLEEHEDGEGGVHGGP